MKKVLFVAVFLGQFTSSFAQEWAPIGAKWTYTWSDASSSYKDTAIIRSIGDTLILGKNCRILKRNYYSCSSRPLKEFTYADSGKVYFYDNSQNAFQMLYNFNANAGDNYKICPFANDSIFIHVDSISTTTINSFVLKTIFVHQLNLGSNWPFVGGKIIENIGDTWSMFSWLYGACDATFDGPLRCYNDTVIGFHDFNTAPSCDFVGIVGIEEIQNHSLTLSPNPFTQSTQITLKQTYHNIALAVYDIQGKQVAQQHYADCDKILFSRNQLSNGLYFLKLTLDDKEVETGKIVVSE